MRLNPTIAACTLGLCEAAARKIEKPVEVFSSVKEPFAVLDLPPQSRTRRQLKRDLRALSVAFTEDSSSIYIQL